MSVSDEFTYQEVIPVTPTPDTATIIEQGEATIDQNLEVVYQSTRDTQQQVLDTGMTGITQGTFPDQASTYIIDGQTLYNPAITLPSLWCQ